MRLGAALICAIVVILVGLAAAPPFEPIDRGTPAANIVIVVTNVRNANGVVRAALCLQFEFLTKHCGLEATAPAQAGTVRLILNGVPPGRYAIQAWHDENNKGRIDRDWLGIPLEGVGFSNDPRLFLGPPSFNESAVSLTPGNNTTRLRLRYFK